MPPKSSNNTSAPFPDSNANNNRDGRNSYFSQATEYAHSLRQTALESANYLSTVAATAVKYLAIAFAALAVLVLLFFIMLATSTFFATATAMSVRMYALWGVPQSAEIPLPFDFSHRIQRCGVANSNTMNDAVPSSCALATSTLNVRCLMNITSLTNSKSLSKSQIVDDESENGKNSASSSWVDYFWPSFLSSSSASSKRNNHKLSSSSELLMESEELEEDEEIEMSEDGEQQDNEDDKRKRNTHKQKTALVSTRVTQRNTELVPFLDPAYEFVAGARYALSVEMKVPASAVCHGMITTQVELHASNFVNKNHKTDDGVGTVEIVEAENYKSENGHVIISSKTTSTKTTAKKMQHKQNHKATKKARSDQNGDKKSSSPASAPGPSTTLLLSAAASAAVVSSSPEEQSNSIANSYLAQEFWLTKLIRNLIFLPINIFAPNFGRLGFFGSLSPFLASDELSFNQQQQALLYENNNNKNLLKFDLIQRFSPPQKVANMIRYLNFSIFSQSETGACCRSQNQGCSSTQSTSANTGMSCLRIFDPVLKISVELDSLLARLHQGYPVMCFFAIFIPVWLFVFCSIGAVLLGLIFVGINYL